jgi:hypothetical protein
MITLVLGVLAFVYDLPLRASGVPTDFHFHVIGASRRLSASFGIFNGN